MAKAHAKELSGLSITDHDTVAAYTPELLQQAQQLGISLIPGIEISASFAGTSVHVLGYAFNLNHPLLTKFQVELQNNRAQRNQQMIAKLNQLGIPITNQLLQERFGSETVIGRLHLAQMLVELGVVNNIKQAFKRFLGDKGRCYVRSNQISVAAAIDLIHQINGYAVLAHPALLPRRQASKICEHQFDGIEVYYGQMNEAQVAPWLKLAQAKDWLITGGSDFHGPKQSAPLGRSFTPPEQFAKLTERFTINCPNLI